MRIEQLIYLADIAQTGSITTTAQRVFLSQQAVSESIRSLERELGCKLLNRSKTGVTLTSKGLVAAEHANDMVEQYHALLAALSEVEDACDFTGQLLVATSPMVSASIFPGVQHHLKKYYPSLELQTQNVTNDVVVQNIVNRTVDLGFCYYTSMELPLLAKYREQYPALELKKLYSNRIVYCMRKDSSLFYQKDFMEVGTPDMKGFVIFFSSDYAGVEKQFHHQVKEHAFSYDSFLVSGDIALIQDLILRYDAICAMPELSYRMFFNYREYTAIPFPETVSDDLYCVYDNDRYEPHFDAVITAVEREIRNILRKQLKY